MNAPLFCIMYMGNSQWDKRWLRIVFTLFHSNVSLICPFPFSFSSFPCIFVGPLLLGVMQKKTILPSLALPPKIRVAVLRLHALHGLLAIRCRPLTVLRVVPLASVFGSRANTKFLPTEAILILGLSRLRYRLLGSRLRGDRLCGFRAILRFLDLSLSVWWSMMLSPMLAATTFRTLHPSGFGRF